MTLFNLHREHIDGFLSPSLTHLLTPSKTTRLRVTVTDSLHPILRGIPPPPHESQEAARAQRRGRHGRRQHKAAAAVMVDSLRGEGWMINRLLEYRHGQDLRRAKHDLEDGARGPCPVSALQAWKQRKTSQERDN